ncbi:hypothetical protein [Negadavirga shengliensis]|uniref:Uncharacterized protein n=1 Tax=Negadavirga shengliensis TaxID=1389218 RepID=A0ABV9T5P5_9BACT
MKTSTLFAFFLLIFLQAYRTFGQVPMERVKAYQENPHYLSWNEKPVFLIGATGYHSWTPISRPGTSEIELQLQRLADLIDKVDSEHVMGFVRWLPYDPMNHLHDGHVEEVLQPWIKLQNGKYDLGRFEPEWEQRLRKLLTQTLNARIIVCLEIWDDWSVTRGPGGAYDPGANYGWNGHPFNPNNNVNYDEKVLPYTTSVCDPPFYNVLPGKEHNDKVFQFQTLYVDHLLRIVKDYPHVMLNINNESRADLAWSRYWAAYVQEKTGGEILVGDMPSTNRKDGGGECDEEFNPMTLSTDGLYGMVDIAQGVSAHEFKTPREQALEGGKRIKSYRDAMDKSGTIKPLLVSKDYTRDENGGDMVIWSRFINGTASSRFHRPSGEHPSSVIDYQHAAMLRLGKFVANVPFWEMSPQKDLIHALPSGTGANALADPTEKVIIQLIDGKIGEEIAINLTGETSWKATWFDPTAEEVVYQNQTSFRHHKNYLEIPVGHEHLIIILER